MSRKLLSPHFPDEETQCKRGAQALSEGLQSHWWDTVNKIKDGEEPIPQQAEGAILAHRCKPALQKFLEERRQNGWGHLGP